MDRKIDTLLIPRRNWQNDVLTCHSVVREQISKTLMLNSSRLALDDGWPICETNSTGPLPQSQHINVNNSSLLLTVRLFFIRCLYPFNLKSLYSCYRHVSLKLDSMCRDHNVYARNIVCVCLRHIKWMNEMKIMLVFNSRVNKKNPQVEVVLLHSWHSNHVGLLASV